MDVTSSIPFTAWEQAVFVVLFIILLAVLLPWFTKQQRSWQDFIDTQNTRWQDAIKDTDARWQSWMKEQNLSQCESMKQITEAIEGLMVKLDEHDGKVEERFAHAIDKLDESRNKKQRNPTTNK